jgi:hypothetical protein
MAYNKSPVWEFLDLNQTGIDKVPLNRLVFIQSTGQMLQKISNNGLTSTSTISDLLNNSSLFKVVSGGGATGGGTDQVFSNTSYTITKDYTIPPGKSSVTVGDANGNVTINSGVTVTVSSGSRWVVL